MSTPLLCLQAQSKHDWVRVAEVLAGDVNKLASIGADFAVLPVNSIQYAYDEIATRSTIPVVNLVELVVQQCTTNGYEKVAVLGVGMTMSDGLYEQPLKNAGIEPIVPSQQDQAELNRIIYDELVPGIINESSVRYVLSVLEGLKQQGCDAVILACTELPMIVNDTNAPIAYVDTTRLLALHALEKATTT